MAKNISEIKIWDRLINEFNKSNLDYVLVGAAALVIHGLPRSTLDIDIYIPASEISLNKIFKIADKTGLKSEQRAILKIRHLPKLFKDQWICFSYKGRDILDVFLAEEEEFNALYKKSEQKKDRNLSIRVASLKDITTMKKISGRPIDLSDLELIKELRHIKTS